MIGDQKTMLAIPNATMIKLMHKVFGFSPFHASKKAVRGCSKLPREKIALT
jgi:hypothetical protein